MNERKLTKSELAKREDIIMKMKDNKRALVQKYGKDAEAVMYGRATNLAKKEAKNMDQDKIKELVKDALQNPKKADLNKDGKLSDYEKKRGAAIEKAMVKELDLDLKGGTEKDKDADIAGVVGAESALGLEEDTITEAFLLDSDIEDIVNALGYSDVYHFFEDNPGAADAIMDWVESIPEFSKMLRDADLREDLDLGHQDNEPHMLKADLYRIGKYAMELYQMVDDFEGQGEVDFPHWWQSKIIKSKDALVGAKHYLDFEIKEPQIDAMVDVAAEEEVIDENAIGINDRRLDDKQKSALDLAVRGDSSYSFGNDPYADDQLRYKYAKKMGFLEEKKEIKEEDPGKSDMVASDIQKAMNKHKGDDAKMHQLQKARTAMNKGDLSKAEKIAKRLAEKLKEGLPKGYWDKKIDAEDEDQDGKVDESYKTLVNKIKKQGKSEKAAKAIAGAVASYKAKGGGKGPTAKQK